MQKHQPQASAKLAGPIGVFAFAVLFALTSCGDAQSSPPAQQAAHFPVTIAEPSGGTVTIKQQPHRIVSLSSTATEMLLGQNMAFDPQTERTRRVVAVVHARRDALGERLRILIGQMRMDAVFDSSHAAASGRPVACRRAISGDSR